MIPIGFIQAYAEKDRYDNDVSIIHMCHGVKYRMVHHNKRFHKSQRATIYAGRGKFVKVQYTNYGNDCMEDHYEVAGYKWSVGDGEVGSVFSPNHLQNLDQLMWDIGDNWEICMINILANIENDNKAWQYKEPRT